MFCAIFQSWRRRGGMAGLAFLDLKERQERRPAINMEISLLTKAKAVKPQSAQETPQEIQRHAKPRESDSRLAKAKLDTAEISGGRANMFEDKRLSVAKSALLYETSADAPEQRINEIREQVRAGVYSVPEASLAGALLD
jgi:anti-sigma28 factor (negative regulator of flagellin synthesis)